MKTDKSINNKRTAEILSVPNDFLSGLWLTLARFSLVSAQYLWNLTIFACSKWIKLSNTASTFPYTHTGKKNIQDDIYSML